MDYQNPQANQMIQPSQPAQTDCPRAQIHQVGILTTMPSEIILHIFKSLNSFADLKALIRASSQFNQVWSQNVSSITKALFPTISNYPELAEDILIAQDLHDQEDYRPGLGVRFRFVTYEKNFWDRIFDFLIRQRDLIEAHCDVIDGTPVEDIIRHTDLVIKRVEGKLAKLDPKILAKEEAMTMKNKSLANMDLLRHAERLIEIEKEMQRYYEFFFDEMRNYFGKALPHRPIELSDEETDRFMKAAYKDAVMEISIRFYDSTLAQAIDAAIISRLPPDEDDQLKKVRDWQLFIRFCDGEPHSVVVVKLRMDELRWRPRRGKLWKSKKGCYFVQPFHFYTKEFLRSMVDAGWTNSMDEQWTVLLDNQERTGDSGNGDPMKMNDGEDTDEDSVGKDEDMDEDSYWYDEDTDEDSDGNDEDMDEDSDENDSDYPSCGLRSPRSSYSPVSELMDEDEAMMAYYGEAYMGYNEEAYMGYNEEDDDEIDDEEEEMEYIPYDGPCMTDWESRVRSCGYHDRHPRSELNQPEH